MPTTDWQWANYTVSMTVLCQKSLLTISDAFWRMKSTAAAWGQLATGSKCDVQQCKKFSCPILRRDCGTTKSSLFTNQRHIRHYAVISAQCACLLAMAVKTHQIIAIAKVQGVHKLNFRKEWQNLTALKCEGFTVNTQTATAHRPGLHHSTQTPKEWKQPATLAIINTKPHDYWPQWNDASN